MNNFKAGDYVVLLASCTGGDRWADSLPINHCYRLRKDCTDLNFEVQLDTKGIDWNGWNGNFKGSTYLTTNKSLLKVRAATKEEVCKYDRLGKPFLTNKYSSLLDRFLNGYRYKIV